MENKIILKKIYKLKIGTNVKHQFLYKTLPIPSSEV